MVHGVPALMNIRHIAVFDPALATAAPGHKTKMVHGVFALMNICHIVDLFYALVTGK
jgi:hypothetical protein